MTDAGCHRYRLTAQAILPGIMQNTTTERVVYGSPEPGKQINVDAAFRDALIPAAKILHLAVRIGNRSNPAKLTHLCPRSAL